MEFLAYGKLPCCTRQKLPQPSHGVFSASPESGGLSFPRALPYTVRVKGEKAIRGRMESSHLIGSIPGRERARLSLSLRALRGLPTTEAGREPATAETSGGERARRESAAAEAAGREARGESATPEAAGREARGGPAAAEAAGREAGREPTAAEASCGERARRESAAAEAPSREAAAGEPAAREAAATEPAA